MIDLKPKPTELGKIKRRKVWVIRKLNNNTVIVMEDDRGYWAVVRLVNGERLMCAFDGEGLAVHWAKRKGYEVASHE